MYRCVGRPTRIDIVTHLLHQRGDLGVSRGCMRQHRTISSSEVDFSITKMSGTAINLIYSQALQFQEEFRRKPAVILPTLDGMERIVRLDNNVPGFETTFVSIVSK